MGKQWSDDLALLPGQGPAEERRNPCPLCLTDLDDPLLVQIWSLCRLTRREQRAAALRQFVADRLTNEDGWTMRDITAHLAHHPHQPLPSWAFTKHNWEAEANWLFPSEARSSKGGAAYLRNWEILRFVGRLKLVTIGQVAEVFFVPTCRNWETAMQRAREVLAQLAYRQILYGVNLEYDALRDGSRKVYGLGRIGSKILETWMEEQPVQAGQWRCKPWVTDPAKVRRSQDLPHDLGVIDLKLRLLRHARQQPHQALGERTVEVHVRAENWWAEKDLGMRYRRPKTIGSDGRFRDVGQGNLFPDGFMAIGAVSEKGERFWPLLIENDTGTKPPAEVIVQMTRYCWLAASRSVAARFPELSVDLGAVNEAKWAGVRWQVPVLFVVQSRQGVGHVRASNLRGGVREQAAEHGETVRSPIFTTTREAFLAAGLQAPVISVWDDKDQERPLLSALREAGLAPDRNGYIRQCPGMPMLPATHELRIDGEAAKPGRSEEEIAFSTKTLRTQHERKRKEAEEARERQELLRAWDQRAPAVPGGAR